MDASRSTDQTTDFVTGKQKVSLEGLTLAQWAAIIRSAVGELPTKYLRGFRKNLAETIPFKGNPAYGVERRVDPKYMRTFEEYDREVYLLCFEREDFPTWEDAPKKFDQQVGPFLQITSDYLLLNRKGQFTWIEAVWQPNEKWKNNSIVSRPAEFWYELISIDYINNVSDAVLIDKLIWFGEKEDKKEPYIPPPARLLISLSRIMSATAADILRQHQRAIKQQAAINGYLERLGLPVFE